MATNPKDERDDRIDEAIAAYHEAREDGLGPIPDEWPDRYPDIAEELRAHFANERRFNPFLAR